MKINHIGYLEEKNHIERCMCDRRTDASVFRLCQYGETVIYSSTIKIRLEGGYSDAF